MNEWIQYAAVVAAILVAASPKIKEVLSGFSWPSLKPSPAPSSLPSFKAAIEALSEVKIRIAGTGHFEESQKQAIDVLTLALVDGSDKQ
jgi:hypothetical protein